MEKSFIIAGFGGQGVMVAGQLLSYTACETTDKYVTYLSLIHISEPTRH